MEKQDYYELLEVPKTASTDEIKKSYRRLARKLHPDLNPGDAAAEERFKQISEAYQVLSDDNKRRQYDTFGHSGMNGAGGGFEDFGFSGFGDIFDMFFGGGGGARGGRRQPRPSRGADVRYDIEISFRDAAFGKDAEIEIPTIVDCEKCSGTGSASGSHPVTCSTCGGSGQVRQVSNTIFGQMQSVVTCPACRGAGRQVPDPCRACSGSGRVRAMKKVKISIPAGVDSGQKLRLVGEGEPGELGGPRGDLYVVVFVAEHEFFKRNGQDIFCEVPISFTQAALGDEIEVPTLRGPEKIDIPAGTQSGMVFRLREKGFPNLRGKSRGDQHVMVKVVVPKKLNSKQKKLLSEFAEAGGEELRRPQTGPLKKIIEMFK